MSEIKNLNYLLERFQETENPIYAIEAFKYAESNGMDIPEAIIKWQADIYRDLSGSAYSESLDSLTRLKRGRGRETAVAEYRRDDLKFICMYWIWVLTKVYKITIIEAATMVYARDSKKSTDMPSVESLEQYYTREKWNDTLSKSPGAFFTIYKYRRNRSALLETFPQDARLPSKLK